jgi:dipeptidyl-peptidase-4
VFQVAVAGSAVTDWRNYDSIYTERYMQTPQENEEGYDAGSCMEFASQLTGQLLLLHGMVDDNVHPTNAWQFAEALNKAQKPYDMLFFANASHSLGGTARFARLEFLSKHLIQPGEVESRGTASSAARN